MFNEQNNLIRKKLDNSEEVKDIFADMDVVVSEKNSASKRFPDMRRNGEKKDFDIQNMRQKQTELENNAIDDKQLKNKKGIIVMIVFLILVIIAIIFAVYYYIFYKTKNNNNNNINVIDIVNINKPDTKKSIDSDSDGLTDDEEKILGTNPNFADSDEDGLLDKEEVKIYHTDPLNFDTDGDGYSDWQEVKSGYNPNGEGKLEIN